MCSIFKFLKSNLNRYFGILLYLNSFSICWGHHTQLSPQAQESMRDFISSLSVKYSFDRSYLEQIFAKVRSQRKALSLIKPSKPDKSQTITWDHYRRLFVNKDNINEKMVKSGFAWVYDRYVKSSLLYSYQDEAKSKTLGIWQSENPIAPWVWRRKK